MRRSSHSSLGIRHSAFTLIELLVVIGIILLLIGLLLPVARKVRISGQTVATQSTINRLVQGCEAYYSEFHAYPGPFADDQIVYAATGETTPNLEHTLVAAGGTPVYPLKYGSPTGPNLGHAPTSSENLFLGLCGGLRVNVNAATNTTTFVYDPELARRATGPLGLSQTVAKKSQGFIDVTDADLSVDSNRNPLNDPSVQSSVWWPVAAATAATTFKGDSQIYEFVDRYSSPKPILYLRANRGAGRVGDLVAANKSGFIFDPNNSANTFPWQYNPGQVEYAYANPAVRNNVGGPGNVWSADVIDYPDLMDPNKPANVMADKGDERYFLNAALTTADATGATATAGGYTRVPVQKDKFILISAGPDGFYGTADDIRN